MNEKDMNGVRDEDVLGVGMKCYHPWPGRRKTALIHHMSHNANNQYRNKHIVT